MVSQLVGSYSPYSHCSKRRRPHLQRPKHTAPPTTSYAHAHSPRNDEPLNCSISTTLNRTPPPPSSPINASPQPNPKPPPIPYTKDGIALQLVLFKEIQNHHKPKTLSPHGNSNTPGICDDDDNALSLDLDNDSRAPSSNPLRVPRSFPFPMQECCYYQSTQNMCQHQLLPRYKHTHNHPKRPPANPPTLRSQPRPRPPLWCRRPIHSHPQLRNL